MFFLIILFWCSWIFPVDYSKLFLGILPPYVTPQHSPPPFVALKTTDNCHLPAKTVQHCHADYKGYCLKAGISLFFFCGRQKFNKCGRFVHTRAGGGNWENSICIRVEAGEMCFTSECYKKQFLIHLQRRGNCLKGFGNRSKKRRWSFIWDKM